MVPGVKRSRGGLVLLIGVLKLAKGMALAALGTVGLALSPVVFAQRLGRTVVALGIYPGHSLLGALDRLATLDHTTEKRLAVCALAYAAVFLVEGVGLVLRRRWAEWLTVVVTASFIPIEIYELVEHFGAGKVITLVLNAAVVAYLVRRRLQEAGSFGGKLRRALGAT